MTKDRNQLLCCLFRLTVCAYESRTQRRTASSGIEPGVSNLCDNLTLHQVSCRGRTTTIPPVSCYHLTNIAVKLATQRCSSSTAE